MKLIKKIFIFITLSVFFITPALAAVDIGTGANGLTQKVANKAQFDLSTDSYTLSQMVGRVIRAMLTFVGTIFLALTVYAGFLWMTAQGNDEKISKATGILRTATIGLIVVVSAYSITIFAMAFASSTVQ